MQEAQDMVRGMEGDMFCIAAVIAENLKAEKLMTSKRNLE